MIGFILIKETGPTPKITKTQHNEIMSYVLGQVAANHHMKYMWMHFRRDTARRYNYKPRNGEGLSGAAFYKSYTGQKLKKKGHMNPLVFSGVSETLAKIRDVRATRSAAVLVQHARGLNRRNPKSDINMAEEIRTVAPSEMKEAYRLSGSLLRKRYREITATQTTRVGG